jgi:D-xylose 1-dehydrogenase (NADP+, D-xylono-1,5-lactone-forming)
MAASTETTSGKAKTMQQPLRWGILGTAEISKEVIRGVHADARCELRAVASRNGDKAKAWAAEHGFALAFEGYEAMLTSGEIDVVYNPLPNSLHAPWTIKALQAGRPVLCEKPLALNAGEARAMATAAQEAGLPLVAALMYRFHPQWEKARDLVASGAIGSLQTMHGQFTFLLDDPTANPASAELGGGALLDVGCYCVDAARRVAGSEPQWVSAFERRGAVDETMVGLLAFPGDVLAHFETSIANFERHRFEIVGTTGSLVLSSPWVPGDDPTQLVLQREGHEPETIIVPAADSYGLEVADFATACINGTSPRWPVADALAHQAVLDALFASARERRAMDPSKFL